MAYQKILLALAGKKEEEKVICEAMRLKTMFSAELSVFHVNDPAAGKTHMMMDTLPLVEEEDIRKQISKSGFTQEASKIKINIIENTNYAEKIANATSDADLLVIGHHHKNKFLAAITDSTDERVADLVACPVLIVPMR